MEASDKVNKISQRQRSLDFFLLLLLVSISWLVLQLFPNKKNNLYLPHYLFWRICQLIRFCRLHTLLILKANIKQMLENETTQYQKTIILL